MDTTKSIYELLKEVLPDSDLHYWQSDLYVKSTEQSRKIIQEYMKVNTWLKPQYFIDEITKKPWIDLPFQYDHFWESKTRSK